MSRFCLHKCIHLIKMEHHTVLLHPHRRCSTARPAHLTCLHGPKKRSSPPFACRRPTATHQFFTRPNRRLSMAPHLLTCNTLVRFWSADTVLHLFFPRSSFPPAGTKKVPTRILKMIPHLYKLPQVVAGHPSGSEIRPNLWLQLTCGFLS